MKYFISFVIYTISLGFSFGQSTQNSVPRSKLLNLQAPESPHFTFPSISQQTIIDQEKLDNPLNQLPPRFGIKRFQRIECAQIGLWTQIPEGRIWRLKIKSENAQSIGLHFDKVNIPVGGELFVYTPLLNLIAGAYNHKHNGVEGGLSIMPLRGNEIIVELFIPNSYTGIPDIAIDYIVHDFTGIFNIAENSQVNHERGEECYIDASCPEGQGFSNAIKSTGLLVIDGVRWCTGSMVNNTSLDFTPYFLTANHCYVENSALSAWMVVFNYQSAFCGDNKDPNRIQSIQVGHIRAKYSPSDFMLLELKEQPPVDWGVYYAGWSKVEPEMLKLAAVHHPGGGFKKISLSNELPQRAKWNNQSSLDHWKLKWTSGSTGIKSSGSALFNSQNQIIGQLHGGTSSCDNPLGYDFFGMFSSSWDGGGNIATRLSDWLNPTEINFGQSLEGSFKVTLPVNLLSFYGKTQGANIRLIWLTTSEENIEKYEVEKMNPDGTFIKFGELEAKGVLSQTSYFLEDPNPQSLNYYRINVLEKNGQNHYSKIILVRNTTKHADGFNLFPNPATDFFSLSYSVSSVTTSIKVVLASISGQILRQYVFEPSSVDSYFTKNFDISDLPKGYYTVTVSNGFQIASSKLMK